MKKISLLYVLSVIWSVAGFSTAEDLRNFIMGAKRDFCEAGSLFKNTIRSKNGDYCNKDEGAVLAKLVCGYQAIKDSQCVTNKSSKMDNFLNDQRVAVYLDNNANKVCKFLKDEFKLDPLACLQALKQKLLPVALSKEGCPMSLTTSDLILLQRGESVSKGKITLVVANKINLGKLSLLVEGGDLGRIKDVIGVSFFEKKQSNICAYNVVIKNALGRPVKETIDIVVR